MKLFTILAIVFLMFNCPTEAFTKPSKPKKKEAYVRFDNELTYQTHCCPICYCPQDFIVTAVNVQNGKPIGFISAESYREMIYDTLFFKDYSSHENGFNEENGLINESKYTIKPEWKDHTYKVLYTETICKDRDHNAYGACEFVVEKHNIVTDVKDPITFYWIDKRNTKHIFDYDMCASDSSLYIFDYQGLNGFSFEGFGNDISITILHDEEETPYSQQTFNLKGKLVKKLKLKTEQQYGTWDIIITHPNGLEKKFKIYRISAAG